MKSYQVQVYLLLSILCAAAGCAEIIRIPRHNGTYYELSGNRLGNKKIKYNVELYSDGKTKAESYEYERDIASPIGQVGHIIAEAIGAAGNKL